MEDFVGNADECDVASIIRSNRNTLRKVAVWCNYDSSIDLRAIAPALRECRRLESLTISYGGITDVDLRALGGITTLVELDLYGNRITDVGAAVLADMVVARNPNWYALSLIHNEIEDSGAGALAHALARSSSLRRINLRGNMRLTSKGAAAFARAIETCSRQVHVEMPPHAQLPITLAKQNRESKFQILALCAGAHHEAVQCEEVKKRVLGMLVG